MLEFYDPAEYDADQSPPPPPEREQIDREYRNLMKREEIMRLARLGNVNPAELLPWRI